MTWFQLLLALTATPVIAGALGFLTASLYGKWVDR